MMPRCYIFIIFFFVVLLQKKSFILNSRGRTPQWIFIIVEDLINSSSQLHGSLVKQNECKGQSVRAQA